MKKKEGKGFLKNYLNWGRLRGRRRFFTAEGTSPGFGRAGLVAQSAAFVNCVTNEKCRSGPEVVRKTRLILERRPVDGGGIGFDGIGAI